MWQAKIEREPNDEGEWLEEKRACMLAREISRFFFPLSPPNFFANNI